MIHSTLFLVDQLAAVVETAAARIQLSHPGACVNVDYKYTPPDPEDRGSVAVFTIYAVRTRGRVVLRSDDDTLELAITPNTDVRHMLTERQLGRIEDRLAVPETP